MMLIFLSWRLSVHIISAGEDLINDSSVLYFTFKLNIHFIANGYRVGRRDPIDLKDPFNTGIICSAGLIFDRVPASCGFVNKCLHFNESGLTGFKPARERQGFG